MEAVGGYVVAGLGLLGLVGAVYLVLRAIQHGGPDDPSEHRRRRPGE